MTCNHDILRQAHPQGLCVLCDTQAPESVVPVSGKSPSGASPCFDFEALTANAKAARIELSKRHLSEFVRNAWHVLEPNTPLEWSWHIEAIADHVQWMLEQWMGRRPHTVENLVCNVPPGSMKSLILNVFAPAWMWLPCNAPHWDLLTISGSDSIVIRDADKTRDLIKSSWYQGSFLNDPQSPGYWQIRHDRDATKSFKNTLGGWRKSQTQAAKVTGDRFDAIFLDDPNDIKDISAVKLKHVERTWYAAGNRLNDMRRAIRIVIQQRTNEGDLTGVIMEERKRKRLTNAKLTEHLCIPMEYLPPGYVNSEGEKLKCACGDEICDTTLGKKDPRTEIGEVLHPERNTGEVIASEKVRLGSLGTAGQLNQRPAPLAGGMFKREFWGVYDEIPRDRRGYRLTEEITMSVDSTFGGVNAQTGDAQGSSRVAIIVAAKLGAKRYIMDVVYGKFSYPETKKKIKALYEKWIDPLTKEYMITKTIIENKGNGPALLADLGGDIPGMVADNPNTDKMSRANTVLPQCEAGNVLLLRDAPWVEEFKHELGVFPNGKFDDIVDALTQVLIAWMVSTGLARTRRLCVE